MSPSGEYPPRVLDPRNQSIFDDIGAVSVNIEHVLEVSKDASLVLDGDLQLAGYNEAARSIFGLGPASSSRPLSQICHDPDARSLLLRAVRLVQATKQRVEIDPMDVDGRRLKGSAVPLNHAGSETSGVLLQLRDVMAVQQLEQRFEWAIEAAFMNWWEWNIETDHVEVYVGNHCLLDYAPEDLPTNREGWEAMIHPSDLDYVEHNLGSCLAGHTDKWFCECRMRTADGGWIWVDHRGKVTRRDNQGKPLELMGTSQDIDAIKRAHLDMRSKNDMLEQAGQLAKLGTWEYLPETETITWSKETRRILGVDDHFEASAEAFYECLVPEDAAKVSAEFAKVLDHGKGYNLRLRCINKRGERIIVRTACRARYDLFGALVRVSGIFQDITDEEAMGDWEERAPDSGAS